MLLATACGGAARPATAVPVPARPPDPPASVDEVRAALLSADQQLSLGFTDDLAHDETLLLLGVRPGDVANGFDAGHALELHRFLGDRPAELASKDLRVVLARDGTCAWFTDDVSYRVAAGRRRAFLPVRQTGVLERRDGRWVVVLEHLSYSTTSVDAVEAESARLPEAAGEDREVQDVRRTVLAVLTGEESAVSLEPDASVLGPGAEQASGRDVGRWSTPLAFFPRGAVIAPTGVRVELARSRTVAWSAATFDVRAGGTLPARASFVLEKRGGAWRVVATHVSRPVSADTLLGELGLRREH
jgi:hypothetical protein